MPLPSGYGSMAASKESAFEWLQLWFYAQWDVVLQGMLGWGVTFK